MNSTKKYFLVLVFATAKFFIFSQNNKIDSLRNLADRDKEDTIKVFHLSKLYVEYRKSGLYNEAMDFAEKILELSEKLNYKKGIAAGYQYLGNISLWQCNYQKALQYYFILLKIHETERNMKGQADTYNNIGVVYLKQENYTEALKNQFAALHLKEKLSEGGGDRTNIASSLNNIGLIFENLGKHKEALENYFTSAKIYHDAGNKAGAADAYSNIGGIYMKIGENDSALKYDLIALKIREQIRDKQGLITSKINLGLLKITLNNVSESKQLLTSALNLSEEIGSIENIRNSYKGLAYADSALGNFRDAYEDFKLYVHYRDSLINEENTKKITQQQMQYDFDKKSTADSIRNSEAKKIEGVKHQQEISKQKTFTYGGIFGFVVMIIVAGISFRAFKNKQKATILIEQQKALVEEKQKEILDSIRYARRIQTALLTSEKYINRKLNQQKK